MLRLQSDGGSPPPCLRAPQLKIFFEKLAKYIGQGIKALVDRPDGRWCFRLHRDRVYYLSEQQVRPAVDRCLTRLSCNTARSLTVGAGQTRGGAAS
jgi:hypothetical protein